MESQKTQQTGNQGAIDAAGAKQLALEQIASDVNRETKSILTLVGGVLGMSVSSYISSNPHIAGVIHDAFGLVASGGLIGAMVYQNKLYNHAKGYISDAKQFIHDIYGLNMKNS